MAWTSLPSASGALLLENRSPRARAERHATLLQERRRTLGPHSHVASDACRTKERKRARVVWPHSLSPSSARPQKSGTGGDHRCRSVVDGVDDLGVVDPLEVDRFDPEVRVRELTLDHDQRDSFAGHLNSVRMA